MKFIQLTRSNNGQKPTPYLVNAERIQTFAPYKENKEPRLNEGPSFVKMIDSGFDIVEESCVEILTRIQG